MQYKQIRCDSLINEITTKDDLFMGDYTVDPYQHCEFGCRYCDSTVDDIIYIKTNAAEVFDKELKQKRKGRVIVGSVHDPYQNVEKDYKITRELIEVIERHDFSCHILTKSPLILRDKDILSHMKSSLVTMSISSLNEETSKLFEKHVPLPKERLQIIQTLSENGIKTGLAVMPILPFIVESEFENIIKSARNYNAQYVIHKHLELKGDQKTRYMTTIQKHFPKLMKKYDELYKDSYMPNTDYILDINKSMEQWCKKYKIKKRIET